MTMQWATLLKSKTFWTSVAGLATAIGGGVSGAMDPGTAIQTGLTALVGIFLRDAIAKG
jgi:hypothetical protein